MQAWEYLNLSKRTLLQIVSTGVDSDSVRHARGALQARGFKF